MNFTVEITSLVPNMQKNNEEELIYLVVIRKAHPQIIFSPGRFGRVGM